MPKPGFLITDPPIVGVPEKLDDIVELLNTEQFANHIGLKAALESSMHRRSSKNAYILLIGFTGAGKSTTVRIVTFINSS